MLLNSKRHIDRRGAEVNMVEFTVQSHSMSTDMHLGQSEDVYL